MEQIKDDVREKILSGSLLKVIVILVFPILGSHILETAWHFLNGFWIGKLGPVSFAAINISSFFVWMFYALVAVVDTGTSSLVAQMEGAGEHEKAREIAHQGIMGNLTLALLYSVFMLFLGRRIFSLMGAEEAVVDEACRYTHLIFLFGVPFGFMEIVTAILRGYGNTRTPFIALSMGFLLIFIFDPLLILGIGPFPKMGITGGAIATVCGFSVSTLIYVVLLLRKRLQFWFSKEYLRIQPEMLWRIVQIGLPPSIASIIFSLVYIFLTSIVARFGTEAMAALGIGHRIESLSFLICLGFSYTAVTLVGQNVGAGNTKRAEKAAWLITAIISAVSFLIAIAYYYLSHPLATIFARDPKTLEIAIHYLKIISFCQVFMGISIVLDGAFSGSGDTVPPMVLSISLNVLRLPLAYLLAISFSMGTDGIWWTITILCILRGICTALLFSLGRWKQTKFVQILK